MNATPITNTRQTSANLAALILGLPLAAAGLGFVLLSGWFDGTIVHRYLAPWVDQAEVVLFCCALAALAAKLAHLRHERHALRAGILPAWDGQPAPVAEASKLRPALTALPPRLRDTYVARRIGSVLDFLTQRRSANDLDDQMRSLADGDAIDLESSYSLIRFITWAVPMLGFIGTVLGITQAIAGVTPEVLEQSLSTVTDGLALAFDSTALALCLTMIVMFCSFVVERQEQSVLEEVDRQVERSLAHRFQRTGVESGPFIGVIQQATQAMLEATGQLVQRQAEIWGQTLAVVDRRAGEAQGKLAGVLEAALERTLTAHGQRLAAFEKHAVDQVAGLAAAVRDTSREQQAALTRTAESVANQSAALGRLFEGEKQVLQLQAMLQQNLAALEGAGAFEQAVHSLSAAVHLLTAKVGRTPAAEPELKAHVNRHKAA